MDGDAGSQAGAVEAEPPVRSVALRLAADETVSYASTQNEVPIGRHLEVTNNGSAPLIGVTVNVKPGTAFARPKAFRFDVLEPGQVQRVEVVDLTAEHAYLAGLAEAEKTFIEATARLGEDEPLATARADVELMAYDQWPGMRALPSLLGAFSQPNVPAVDHLLRDASQRLRKQQTAASLNGYQANSREAVWMQLSAIYAAICGLDVHYAVGPASFETTGQKIRTADRILESRLGNCLDLTMLFASCIEQAGLRPVVLFKRGHAWIGCWLIDTHFATSITDDLQSVRKRVATGEFITFECTGVTAQPRMNLRTAQVKGQEHLDGDDFEYAIDISRCRQERIKPLPTRTSAGTLQAVVEATEVAIEEPPALPPLDVAQTIEITRDEGRLGRWKAKLLDMTLRNRLLAFKKSKSNIEIITHSLADLEDKVASGVDLTFKPFPAALDGNDPRSAQVYTARHGRKAIEDIAADALAKNELVTAEDDKTYEGHLLEIFLKARSGMEESGANALFLAVGFLQWTESETSEKKNLAPILMLPVSLTRASVRTGFRLRKSDDEPFVNPTLLQLLREQFELNIETADLLPADQSGIDVARVLQAFRLAIRDYKGWEVKDKVHLGNFSFAKWVMWRDLQNRLDDLMKSRVVRHLLTTPGAEYQGERFEIDQRELDERYPPQQLLTPLLADSSQIAAIAKIKAGADMVVIGPPGCGKTQVLANAVADLLADGKSVLVVSEKMAALDVLHRRLRDIGLGPFVLELHSAKANKAGVLKQMEEALGQAGAMSVDAWEREAQRLASLREALNSVVRSLHRRHRNGLTAYEATGTVVNNEGTAAAPMPWPDADAHDEKGLDELRDSAKQIQALAGELTRIHGHPLEKVLRGDWSSDWQDRFVSEAASLSKRADLLERSAAPVLKHLGMQEAGGSLEIYRALDELADVLLTAPTVPLGFARQAHDPELAERVKRLREHTGRRQEAWDRLGGKYEKSLDKVDGQALQQRWRQCQAKWLLPRWLGMRALRNELSVHSTNKSRPTADEIDSVIEAVITVNAEDKLIAGLTVGQDLVLSGAWSGVYADPAPLALYERWARRFQIIQTRLAGTDFAAASALRERLQHLVGEQRALLKPEGIVGQQLLSLRDAARQLNESLRSIGELTDNKDFAGGDHDLGLIARLRADAEKWQGAVRQLRAWANWRKARRTAIARGLEGLVEAIESGAIATSAIAAHFEYSYRKWWLGKVVDRDPVLREFSSADHGRKILEFREADANFQELSKQYIRAKLAARVPEQRALQPANESEMGRLRREMTKQRAHVPIRRLIEGMPTLLTRLKPCLLMSPLSVAQYLDASKAMFDVVLFDEGSQIPAHDAIGAIARAKQAVVVGDPKQLPPTSFFTKTEGSDDAAEEQGEVADLESILDECLGAGLPKVNLTWHYRSRYEALIAFSNSEYYDGSLITFPSNVTEDRSVELRKVNGVYDRGASRTNRIEAERVVQEIEEHVLDPVRNQLSIGVVTFNQPQQQLIEQLLDARRRQSVKLDSLLAERTHEPLMIKNLEAVQGDERDIMLFSICFGRDLAGKMTMNFGPLNLEGGHRRLNVAVTRARERIIIFSSLMPEEIDPGRVSARGVLDLKSYLEYAVKGPQALLAKNRPTGRGPDSPFEAAVIARLRDRGWNVHSQVGVSGYRIDIGIVDPRAPGRYLLGIECDGARYHSAATARDRDRLRQLILEGLGWKLHRIWSTDWWTDPQREMEKLLGVLDASLKENQEASATPAASTPKGGTQESTAPERTKHEGAVEPARVEQPAYKAVTPQGGPNDQFHDRRSDGRIRSDLTEVVNGEGPVLESVLFKRVLSAWGFERAGSGISQRVAALATGFRTTGTGDRRFYWRADQDPLTYREFRVAAGTEDSKRSADQLCSEELQNIASYVLLHSGAMHLPDLAREIWRVVGIKRVTKDMIDLVELACLGARPCSGIAVEGDLVKLKAN